MISDPYAQDDMPDIGTFPTINSHPERRRGSSDLPPAWFAMMAEEAQAALFGLDDDR